MGVQYDSGERTAREIGVNDAIVRSNIQRGTSYCMDEYGPAGCNGSEMKDFVRWCEEQSKS
jgi:hypothetical protein